MKRIFIGLYAPIDSFPPTINLINEFIHKDFEVFALEIAQESFKHSDVNLDKLESLVFSRALPKFISNYILFFNFIFKTLKIARRQKIKNFVVFDAYGLLTIFILKSLRLINKNSKVWYHNHDIGYSQDFKFFSLGWLAHKAEFKVLKSTDFFTLPSKERSSYFLTRNCDFILPNYPSLKIYNKYQSKLEDKTLSLIFQGRINEGHGFESIIKLLDTKINEFSIKLVLKGIVTESYKKELLFGLSPELQNRITFLGYSNYENLPNITSNAQVGIAIHQPRSLMHATLGTASNKIYEYAACGLPIIYLNNDHFNGYLNKYSWAFPVSDNSDSIKNALLEITNNYKEFSFEAKRTFINNLNYETFFDKAISLYNPYEF